jgi:ABC-2 type transport system ATP-binding protein
MTVVTEGAAPAAARRDLALATRGLVKRYGSRTALAGLDLAVPRGLVYGFLGPNGAGKTTTMRLLVGLLRADAGSIELLGEPYTGRERRRLFRVGALIESPTFYPYLSGADNLRVLAATGAPTRRQRVEEVLDFVGLRERGRDKVGNYSLGMKQRLGIAGALLSDPELLLLDEPANGLDPAGIVAMRQTLRHLTGMGKTVFISSHILPEVEQLADVVGIVDRGQLVREGTLQQLLEEGGHIRLRVGRNELPRVRELVGRLGDVGEPEGGDQSPDVWVTLAVAPARAVEVNRALAEGGVYVSGLTTGSDLESVYMTLTTHAPPPDAHLRPPSGWGEAGASGDAR